MPENGQHDVEASVLIWGGWASGHAQVQITPTLTLFPSSNQPNKIVENETQRSRYNASEIPSLIHFHDRFKRRARFGEELIKHKFETKGEIDTNPFLHFHFLINTFLLF